MVRIFGNILIALTLMFFIGAVPLAAAEKGAAKEKKAVEEKAKPEKKDAKKAEPAQKEAEKASGPQTGLDIKIAELKKEIEVLKQKGEEDRVRALERRLKEYEIDNEIDKLRDDIRTFERESKKAEADAALAKIDNLKNDKTDFILTWLAEELRWATKVVDTIKIQSILAELNGIGDKRYMEKRDALLKQMDAIGDKDPSKKSEVTNKLDLLFIDQQILGFERELASNAVLKKEAQIAHDTQTIDSLDARISYTELAMELARLDISIESEKDQKQREALKDRALEVNLKRIDAQKPSLLYEVEKSKLSKKADIVINFLDLYHDVDVWKEVARLEREVEKARVSKDDKKADALEAKMNFLGKQAASDEKNPQAFKDYVEYARSEKLYSDMERYNEKYYQSKIKNIKDLMTLEIELAGDKAKASEIADRAEADILALLKEKEAWITKWAAEQEKEGILNIGLLFSRASAEAAVKITEIEIQERKLSDKNLNDPKIIELRKEALKMRMAPSNDKLYSDIDGHIKKAVEKGNADAALDLADMLYRMKAEAEVQGILYQKELANLAETLKSEAGGNTPPMNTLREPAEFQKEKEIWAKYSKEKIAALNEISAQFKAKGSQAAVDAIARSLKLIEMAQKRDLLRIDLSIAKAKDDAKAAAEIEKQLQASESDLNKYGKELFKTKTTLKLKDLEARAEKTEDVLKEIEEQKRILQDLERD